MNVPAYLARLGWTGPLRPDLATLRGLHSAHLLAVPFENLDIALGRTIELTPQALWQKIVLDGRGGFCYELNGLFGWLLLQTGFEVTHLNARVFNATGQLGSDFDHLTLLVRTPGQPGRWLADVGFGDSFLEPLQIDDDGEQVQGLRAYRLEPAADAYVLWQRNFDGTWERQYSFDLLPREFPTDYEAACRYHQTSPLSSFTRRRIISRATPDGRVSLEDGRLIVTRAGRRTERRLNAAAEFDALLAEHFGIVF